MREWKVGDSVFLAFSDERHKPNEDLVVTKIGRKWISLGYSVGGYDQYRFDNETLCLDGSKGYSSPGRVYRDKDEYIAFMQSVTLWNDFYTAVSRAYSNPNEEFFTDDRLCELIEQLKK